MQQPVVNQPAAWYPQADGQQRYWDGEQWTEHFAPGGPPVPAPVAEVATGKAARPWFKKKRFVLPAIAVVLIVIASSTNGGGKDVAAVDSSTAAPAAVQPKAVTPAEKAAAEKAAADQAAAAKAASAKASADQAAADKAAAAKAAAGAYDQTYGTFATITKSGRGDSIIALPKGAKAGLVTATHQGSANFQVSGMDAGNKSTIDGLVNAIGNYSGTTAYGLTDMGNAPIKLQIVADGSWTIKIAPISSASVLPASASGKGDAVFKFEGAAADFAITHKGSANFQVQQYGGDLSMGVNEIGNYSGTVPFVAGPTVLVIGADGTWTFKKQ